MRIFDADKLHYKKVSIEDEKGIHPAVVVFAKELDKKAIEITSEEITLEEIANKVNEKVIVGKDKNFKELHEGDICKYRAYLEEKGLYEFIGKIEYCPDYYSYAFNNIEAHKISYFPIGGKYEIEKNDEYIVEYAPSLLMSAIDMDSIEKIDEKILIKKQDEELKLFATNIEWDTDEDPAGAWMLPDKIEIPITMTDLEEISDYISDKTGFCHNGFFVDCNKSIEELYKEIDKIDKELKAEYDEYGETTWASQLECEREGLENLICLLEMGISKDLEKEILGH